MPDGIFRLRSRELIGTYGVSIYQAAKDGDVSYSTLHRWVTYPEEVVRIECRILYGFLAGLGLSLDQINNLTIGEVFDFQPHEGDSGP